MQVCVWAWLIPSGSAPFAKSAGGISAAGQVASADHGPDAGGEQVGDQNHSANDEDAGRRIFVLEQFHRRDQHRGDATGANHAEHGRLTDVGGEAVEDGATTRRAFEAALAAAKIKVRTVMEIGSRETIRASCLAGA
jgi:hypothetical protein